MLRLDFDVFINRYKLQFEANDRATLHYKEDDEKFTLYFKNYEYWEYYTIVDKEAIIEYGASQNVGENRSIEEFKINYLSHAVKLAEDSVIESIDNSEPLGSPVAEINKSNEDDTDIDVVDEAEDYEEFFIKVVEFWEKMTLKALDNISVEKLYDPETNKTFGEFIKDLFNGVNTIKFLKKLKVIIKRSMVKGMDSASEEMEVDVGWSNTFQDKLKAFEKQQLDGYMINGKKWYGIKGASQDIRMKILKSVQEDVVNKVGKDIMAKNIQKIFGGAGISRAKAIARTETTRFVNESKLTSYTESGIKGTKAWDAVMDSHTAELDARLHKKYNKNGIPFDEEFVDDKTGLRFMNPPTRTNCRCVISYRAPNLK